MSNNIEKIDYDVFICYETTTGLDYAVNLKNALKKLSRNAFVAKLDIPLGIDEEEFRFKKIALADHFILIFTNLTFKSPEVEKEIEEAITKKKEFIICLDHKVDERRFEQEFPKLSIKQRIRPFSNNSELAKEVTDWFDQLNFSDLSKGIEMEETSEIGKLNELVVEPLWSVKNISESENKGHIIFKIKNITGKKVLIYGYRMFRVNPNGNKDFFYNGFVKKSEEFTGWISDPHFKITLWNNDEHIFHWNDVSISTIYGLNSKGKWDTELQIAYLVEGIENKLFISIGHTYIEHL